jgi:acetylornithine deacetylase/succinyl-diaminopimelate desuccinylase-like protein
MEKPSRTRSARLAWTAGLLALATVPPCVAQRPTPFHDAIDSYRREHEPQVLRDLSSFLAIPNLASDKPNIRRNASELMAMMKTHGIAVRLLESPSGAPPAVYGELLTPGSTKTVMFYAHYDGQPVDTTKWATPPWQPVLRDKTLEEHGTIIPLPTAPASANGEWRLYGRSSSDDKAPIIAMLTAVDALDASHIARSVNVKFFFEGEEEAGSGHLRELLAANAELLKADAWLFGDGPVHQSRRQQIVFGARGVTGAEITVYGPSHALHSGHYGNWAPNPVTLLSNLIASMRNDDGRILVKHYYDDVDPITPADRRAIAMIPRIDSAMRAEVMLNATEAHNAPIAERIMLPALNLRGIQGGAIGATAANAIPTSATASIDFRLVPHQTPAHVRQLIETHLKAQGYFIVDHDPTPDERMSHARVAKVTWEAGYAATRISLDAPLSRALVRATEEALGGPVVQLPILGGSVPLDAITSTLHTPVIVLPIVNHDNNQHAANENLRLQNLFDGIVVYAGAVAKLGQYWK